MARMTEQELNDFLSGPVICRLGTLDDEGWPYVIPVWTQHADGGFYLVPRERSRWVRHLQHDGRCSLCLDVFEEHRRVLVKGRAVIQEEPNTGGAWVSILKEMAERYWGERGLRYWQQTLAGTSLARLYRAGRDHQLAWHVGTTLPPLRVASVIRSLTHALNVRGAGC